MRHSGILVDSIKETEYSLKGQVYNLDGKIILKSALNNIINKRTINLL